MVAGIEKLAADMAAMDLRLTREILSVGTNLQVHVVQCTAAHHEMTETVERLTAMVLRCMRAGFLCAMLLAVLAIGLKMKPVIAMMEAIGLF